VVILILRIGNHSCRNKKKMKLVTIKSYQKENSLSSYVLLFHFLFIVALRPIIMKFYYWYNCRYLMDHTSVVLLEGLTSFSN